MIAAARKRMLITGLILAPLLAALAVWLWYWLIVLPERRAVDELRILAEELAPVLRAETLDETRLGRIRARLRELSAQGRPGEELLAGAAAFLADNLREADRRLAEARALAPNEPYLASFRAAVNLRQGNTALAKEMYLKSLTMKSRAGFAPASLTDDQLGLALGLFMLHRPAEALPLAEQAWRTRSRYLGADDPDTLAAANRLATVYVALKRDDQADALLQSTYQAALIRGPEAAAALEETRLLMIIIYNQAGRLDELQDMFGRDSGFGAEYIDAPQLAADIAPPPELALALEPPPPGEPTAVSEALAPVALPEAAPPSAGEADSVFPDASPGPAPPPEAAPAAEAASAAPPDAPAPLPESARPARPGPAEVTPEILDSWEKTARALAGHDQALAVDLWDKIIFERHKLAAAEESPPDLSAAQTALARACLDSGQYARAAEETRPLLAATADHRSDRFVELSAMMAESLEGEGRFREAEARWQAAADVVDARITAKVRAKTPPESADVNRSLTYHVRLADNFLTQGRVRQEAEIELRAALGRLGRPPLGEYAEVSRVQLHLARLLWVLKRTRDSAAFYRQAQASAESFLKTDPEEPVRAALTELLAEAQAEAKNLANKRPAPKSLSKKLARPSATPKAKSSEPPSPEMMRLEFSALAALRRLAEFQERLAPVLEEVARRHGEGSQEFMRYYGLKLKGLEQEDRVEELTTELAARAEYPPGRNEAERALNRGSALIYAARVNERVGRLETAVDYYQRALTALKDRPEETLAVRRRAVEAALVRLGHPAGR